MRISSPSTGTARDPAASGEPDPGSAAAARRGERDRRRDHRRGPRAGRRLGRRARGALRRPGLSDPRMLPDPRRGGPRRRSSASIRGCDAALDTAAANIRAVAEAQLVDEQRVKLEQGQSVELREVPVASAAVYAPGGTASYPSTVLMGCIPAKVAQVSPRRPRHAARQGERPVSDLILAAAAIGGADEIYPLGGAQAIAALAIGTAADSAGRRDRRPRQPLRPGGEAPAGGRGRHRRDRGALRADGDRGRDRQGRLDRARPLRPGGARLRGASGRGGRRNGDPGCDRREHAAGGGRAGNRRGRGPGAGGGPRHCRRGSARERDCAGASPARHRGRVAARQRDQRRPRCVFVGPQSAPPPSATTRRARTTCFPPAARAGSRDRWIQASSAGASPPSR